MKCVSVTDWILGYKVWFLVLRGATYSTKTTRCVLAKTRSFIDFQRVNTLHESQCEMANVMLSLTHLKG